jgi:predicted ArsR family transcriptional regulator
MENEKRQQILAEILSLSTPPAPVEEDEITVRDYAQAAECSVVGAQRRLDRLVDQGVLSRREATRQGRICRAYRKVTNEP